MLNFRSPANPNNPGNPGERKPNFSTKSNFQSGVKDIESVLFNAQIDSHQSQFTNYRLHLIELSTDFKRIAMRENPTIENIVAYWAQLEASFSYIRSMVQNEIKPDTNDNFEKRILVLDAIKQEMLQYWNFFKFGVCDEQNTPFVVLYRKNNPKNFQRCIQARMVTVSNMFSDLLRVCYQSLSYYFRQNRVKRNLGVEGDLIRAKLLQIRKEQKVGGNAHVIKGRLIKQMQEQGFELKKLDSGLGEQNDVGAMEEQDTSKN